MDKICKNCACMDVCFHYNPNRTQECKLWQARVPSKWISVKDRLPSVKKMIDGEEYYKTVAVRIAGSEVETIAYYEQDENRWFGTDDFQILEKVTHWCELPEWNLPQPPKGE